MMLHWLTSPEWANTVKALLHTLWQGAIIAVLLGLALRRLDSSVLRYRCSLAALVGIMLAGLVTWAVLNRPVLQPVSHSPASQNQRAAAPEANNNLPPLVVSFPPGESKPVELRWTAWLALLWLAGATVMLGRAGIQLAGAERLRRSSCPLDDPQIANLLAEARRAVGLARRVRIAVTDKLTSPAIVGVLVPTLVLPLSLTTTLTPEQIRFVLLHELAHIRRGDYFANLFQLFVEALLFFNPAVWWISRQLRVEREVCCDTLAIELSGAPVDYARTLVHVAENVLSSAPVAAPAFGDNRDPSSLTDRVQRLLVPGYRPALRLTWRAMLVALLAGGTLLFLSAFGTRATVAAILSPQERIAQIEKKMSEYGQRPEVELSYEDSEKAPKVEVSGRVRMGDGSPLPEHLWLYACSIDKYTSRDTTISLKPDGTFKGWFVSGQIIISTEITNHAPVQIGPITGVSSNKLENLELVIDPGFDAIIQLTDANSGKPVVGGKLTARFWLRGASATDFPEHTLTTTGNGSALLTHAANLPLVVTVNAPGYEILEKRFESVQPNIPLRIPLRAGIKVSGLVLDKVTGQPLSSVTIQVRHEKGPTQQNYPWDDALRIVAKTDANGQFTANQLRSDTVYWLGVSAPGHESVIVDRVSPGANNLTVRLGPEMVVSGRVLGSLQGLQILDRDYALSCSRRAVFDGNNYSDSDWVRLHTTNGVTTFQFTNRVAGVVSLSTRDGKGFERQVDAPVKDWLIDLTEPQPAAQSTVASNLPKREVIFRFKHPPGVPPPGTVVVDVPDNLDINHLTAHTEEKEILNGEVRVAIAIGGRTSVRPKRMVGYWFDWAGEHGSLLSIEVTNGAGPMVIEIPLVPAGAIYAKARNADGTAAGGLFFGVSELKRAPGRDNSSPLDSGGDGISDNLPRKWVSGPLPLGGTYQIYCWRGNLFSVSKPVKLTESNPDAEVELQFPSGKFFDGVILNADGKPLRDAELKVSFELAEGQGFGLKSVFTDGLGRFHLEDMTPDLGRYSVEANVPGVMAEIVKLDFGSQPQTIRLQRGQTLAGRVVEAGTGYAIPNAEVRAWVLDGKLPMLTTQTDADGRFEFTTLGNGDYTLYVADGQLLSNKTFRADGDTNVVLPVKLYAWSKVKPKAPPIKTDSEPAGSEMMTFKIDRPPDADSLKKLLLDAGVKIPPTVYFYTDNGLLLVRGDEKQLALVHSAVLKLNGFMPKEIPAGTNVSGGFRERLDAIVERSHQNTPAGFGKTETMPDISRNAPPLVFSGITNKTTSSAGASTNLETRTSKVDTDVFLTALQKQTGIQTNVIAGLKQILSSVGVDLSPPKSIFYNDRMGVLFVHATEQDLDVVEKAVQVLDYTPPPQIHIKARFIEVPVTLANNLKSYFKPISVTNVVGIMTDPNFRVVIHALEQNQGTESLAEPEVTTLSGRQTQMRATTTKDITTQYLADSDNSTVVPRYEKVEVGPVLDVIPVVLPDGYAIDLTAIPSLTEFLGYDTPTNTILVATSAGTNVTVPTVLPRFRVRQAITHLKLWDNQTVVLGSLQDRLVPGGKEVDVKPGSKIHKQLLVFVTVTLVDRAGNRIHTDDEMQFAQKGIPPQDAP